MFIYLKLDRTEERPGGKVPNLAIFVSFSYLNNSIFLLIHKVLKVQIIFPPLVIFQFQIGFNLLLPLEMKN